MYIVFNHDLNEVLANFAELGPALKDAIEWAEADDIKVSVYSGTIHPDREVLMVDGYRVAIEFQLMFEPDEDFK